MRERQLWAGAESLDETFADVAGLAAQCRFGDCRHGPEPGCAVQAALANGGLDGARWESYRKLCAEIERHRRRDDARATLAEKQRIKRACKAQREHGRP